MARLRNSPSRAGGFLIGAAFTFTLFIALGALAVAVFDPFGSRTVDRSGPAVLEQVRDLQDFTAAEAEFVQDVDIENDVRFVPGFVAGERVVAMATGTVEATVDFSGLDEDSVTVSTDGKSISLLLPEPVLGDADVDESATRIISRQRGIVDRVADAAASNPFDDAEVYEAAAQKLNEAAADTDLVATARDNTEEWLETFLAAAGFDTVVVGWNEAPV